MQRDIYAVRSAEATKLAGRRGKHGEGLPCKDIVDKDGELRADLASEGSHSQSNYSLFKELSCSDGLFLCSRISGAIGAPLQKKDLFYLGALSVAVSLNNGSS